MENLKQRGNEAGVTARVVASNVRRLRKAAAMDQKQLSLRLEEVGWPISVPALSKLENATRRVDVDDLVALSIALGVNPNALLFQPTVVGNHLLKLTGGGVAEFSSSEVWSWARGVDPLQPISELAPKSGLKVLRDKAASEAEAEKFRARVSPGAPAVPGPGVSRRVGTKKGARMVYTSVPIPHYLDPKARDEKS